MINGAFSVYSARLECAQPFELWFRAQAGQRAFLSSRAEAYVAAVLLHVMRTGGELRVHATLSRTFLRNLEEQQEIWRSWYAELQPVLITPDREDEPEPAPIDRAVSTFSGGVDSCFTLWRHLHKLCGRRTCDLQTAVMLHGSEIELGRDAMFAAALARSRRLLAATSVELVPLATNFRQVMPYDYARRGFGSLMVSSLLLFQETHRTGLIPASNRYRDAQVAYGSTPLTDPLFGTRHFRLAHDGAREDRLEKLRAIQGWPGLLENLRVCSLPATADKNCGRCEKCIRTILTLRLLGVYDAPCFPGTVTDADIRGVWMDDYQLFELQDLVRSAMELGPLPAWMRAVETAIRRTRRRYRWQSLRECIARRVPKAVEPLWRRLSKRLVNE